MELRSVSNSLRDPPLSSFWVGTAYSLRLLLVYLWKLKGNARGDFPLRIIVCHLRCKRLFPGRPSKPFEVITTTESSWLGPSGLSCEQCVFHPGSPGSATTTYSFVCSTATLFILNQHCCTVACTVAFFQSFLYNQCCILIPVQRAQTSARRL